MLQKLFIALFLCLNTFLVQAQCITNQTVTASPTSGVCITYVIVSLGASETGIDYYLRDNAGDSDIEGPIAEAGLGVIRRNPDTKWKLQPEYR